MSKNTFQFEIREPLADKKFQEMWEDTKILLQSNLVALYAENHMRVSPKVLLYVLNAAMHNYRHFLLGYVSKDPYIKTFSDQEWLDLTRNFVETLDE